MYMNGVNLGNWLVLEKWMSPAMFQGTTAEDEYYLPRQLSQEAYQARISIHRSEYITERDFIAIHSMGFNGVRIPVPYFIFGDIPPFIGCVQELDNAFNWAEKYNLQILIDLHTVPEGQNGFDNGGISGVCRWSQNPASVEFALKVLEKLAQRYGTRKSLWGIEVLNEPITERMWHLFDVPNRYPAADKAMAMGSAPNTLTFLRDFYQQAYTRLMKHLPIEKKVVIHDAFEPTHWKDFMQQKEYSNLVLDIHLYLMIAESMGCQQNLEAYKKFIKTHFEAVIVEMQEYFPVICGEWSLFNSLACGCDTAGGQSVLNGKTGACTKSLSPAQKKAIYQPLAEAQLAAWKKGAGHFYWNYKLLTDTVNTPGWVGWDSWDLGRCVNFGWYPL